MGQREAAPDLTLGGKGCFQEEMKPELSLEELGAVCWGRFWGEGRAFPDEGVTHIKSQK